MALAAEPTSSALPMLVPLTFPDAPPQLPGPQASKDDASHLTRKHQGFQLLPPGRAHRGIEGAGAGKGQETPYLCGTGMRKSLS